MRTDRFFNWHQFHADEHLEPMVVDSRRRLRICLWGFATLLSIVFIRMVYLETTQGAGFRLEASQPLSKREHVPGVRGRILAKNGLVLACDREVPSLAVSYRWLQRPADPRWLAWTARKQLAPDERSDPHRLEVLKTQVENQRVELAEQLARLGGLTLEEWDRRTARIQSRVQRISESVNRRRRDALERKTDEPIADSSAHTAREFLLELLEASMDETIPERIPVAEEHEYHVVVENVPLELVARIEAQPDRFPGVKIVTSRRRTYPFGPLAAHVLGHLGPVDSLLAEDESYGPEDRVGRSGLERHYEQLLRGHRGELIERVDRSGRVLSNYRSREPVVGRDLVVSIDPDIQAAAERLLEEACRRRVMRTPRNESAGGVVIVMDVHSGSMLAAASAPGFDPNWFVGNPDREVPRLLDDAAHPLFNRISQMALPPGSVFKTVTATALLQAGSVDPDEPHVCRGYLHTPDRWRCAIYLRHGIGHGPMRLTDALAESCNVYFFHHAGLIAPELLVDWAGRLGFGRPTGVDLPGETAGVLPYPETIRQTSGRRWQTSDSQALAIGQSTLLVTPLQILRMTAAIANGGRLVTPHLATGLGLPEQNDAVRAGDLDSDPLDLPTSQPIPDLMPSTLTTLREGLRRVVADPRGTAYASARLDTISMAGKTGTAQTGVGRTDHAWFAGYVPVDRPKYALVVVLEHAGNASEAACPVAKRMVLAMQRAGYVGSHVLPENED